MGEPTSSPRLPSRYEDLDTAFRGRLRPVPALIEKVQRAQAAMSVSGGLRFLPIFGESGSGKTSAALELSSHLPNATVAELPRDAMESQEALRSFMTDFGEQNGDASLLVLVVDQYEEQAATRDDLPRHFVEWLSLLDRDRAMTQRQWLFLWLTTDTGFQSALAEATSRNRRILLDPHFVIEGPPKTEWPVLVEETFEAHNAGSPLADFGVLRRDIEEAAKQAKTLGSTIEAVGTRLAETIPRLQDLSIYQVVMLWPVTDGQRINTVLRFVNAREGYKVDWNAFYRELNESDRTQLPLQEYNRARLYFDLRLVPIAAADLRELCTNLDDPDHTLHESYLDRFQLTHYISIVRGTWDPAKYSPLRERESERSKKAREWYEDVTTQPTKLGARIARVLRELGIPSEHEQDVASPHAVVRADVLSQRGDSRKSKVITELKVFAPKNTMPSSIRDQIRQTLKRHAQLGGFLQRQ